MNIRSYKLGNFTKDKTIFFNHYQIKKTVQNQLGPIIKIK